MQAMFPVVALEELDTGHWVHSEAYVPASDVIVPRLIVRCSPGEFLKTVYKYIK